MSREKWKVGDRIQFVKSEYTTISSSIYCIDKEIQDAWHGDTGTIIEIDDRFYCEEEDWMLWYIVELDQETLNDGRDRWCKITTADKENAILINNQIGE